MTAAAVAWWWLPIAVAATAGACFVAVLWLLGSTARRFARRARAEARTARTNGHA